MFTFFVTISIIYVQNFPSSQTEALSPFSLPPAQGNPHPNFCLWIWPLKVTHISEIIQYFFFCNWPISPGTMFPRLTCCGARVRMSFLFKAILNSIPFYVHTTFYLSVHQLMDTGVVSTLWLWQIMLLEPGCTNIQVPAFSSSEYAPRHGMAQLSGPFYV